MPAPTRTTTDKIERCRRIIALLRRDAEDGTGTRALVEVGQMTWAVEAFEPGEGHIPILIRAALLQRLLMTVARLQDRGADVDSLPAAFRLLEDPGIAQGVLVDPTFRGPLDAATQQWAAIKGDDRVGRIWLFRTRVLAHSIDLKSDFERPEFDDLMTLARDTFLVAEALAVATGQGTPLLKHTHAIYTEGATKYWSRLAGRRD